MKSEGEEEDVDEAMPRRRRTRRRNKSGESAEDSQSAEDNAQVDEQEPPAIKENHAPKKQPLVGKKRTTDMITSSS